jgi:hypothetical protein
MKKTLLLLVALVGLFSTNAQNLATCKNPCTKTRIVESGPFIGVRINTFCNASAVTVIEVLPNTAAAKFNIEINDIIISFEGIRVNNNQELIDLVAKHQPGDLVSVTLNHAGNVITKNIVLGAQFSNTVTETVCCDEAKPATFKFALSPNPTTNSFVLSSDQVVNGDVNITILDLKGSVVKSVKHTSNGYFNLPINVTGLTNGQYIVRVATANGQFVEKLLIAK